MKFSAAFTVRTHDMDMNGVAKTSVVLRYMQEAVNMQMAQSGLDAARLRHERGLAFILSRVSVSIYSDLTAGDEIEVTTWANESEGVSFRRSAQIRKNGIIVAEMISIWALVNIETKRLMRVRDIDLGFETEPDVPDIDEPVSTRTPSDLNSALMGNFAVRFSDCDSNGHMNNTNYPDRLLDFVSGVKGKKCYFFSIHFVNEARLDEDFKVYIAKDDEKYYFTTKLSSGKAGIDALFCLEDAQIGEI